MNPLNETVRIGRYTLRNRLVMAPMTQPACPPQSLRSTTHSARAPA